MRAIVRLSIDGENNGALRNALVWHLENVHMAKTGTATWESADITPANFALAMCGFWTIAQNPAAVPSIQPGASIDHVWVYCDEPKEAD